VATVKAVTDQMVFTTANQLDTQTISMATNSMTADAAATDFIGAAELAAAASQEIADLIAADWVSGDASPLAIVAALKADAEWSNLATMQTAVTDVQTQVGTAGAGLTDLGGMSTAMKAEVNAEVDTALGTTTYAEPAQGAPAATATLAAKINYLYKFWRNKKDNDGTETTIYADDATTPDHKQTTTISGGTVTLDEWTTGV